MTTQSNTGFHGIHLTGSLPHEDGAEAFRWIGDNLRPWVSRVPDETGERAGFVLTQFSCFFDNPTLDLIPLEDAKLVPVQRAKVKEGLSSADVRFERFGYVDAARASYELFKEAREAGTLPRDARFLVALPTPLSSFAIYVVPEAQKDIMGAYDAQMQATVEELVDTIPRRDLAVQWDLPSETMVLVGFLPNPFESVQAMVDAVVRLSELVPAEVQLGHHLCWGDRNFEDMTGRQGLEGTETPMHFLPTPDDASELTQLANGIAAGVQRPIQFLHTVTALSWNSARNYGPFAELKLHPETEFFVGLVHPQDGIEGARTRFEAFQAAAPMPIGISTPCGMGRYNDDQKFQTAVNALVDLAREHEGEGP